MSTGGTGAEWDGVPSVFFPADFLKIAGSSVYPRDCFLSFECLLSRAYDIGGNTLGAKGLAALLTLVPTGATLAERGQVQWVFFPDFLVKLAR